jgi:hypothetical protein
MAPRKVRPIRVEGNIAYVPLTQGYEAIIDVEDVPLVERYIWQTLVSRHTVYGITKVKGDSGDSRVILLHRLILGAPPDLQVDHRDGDGLNNRRRGKDGNLRLASNAQNGRNGRFRRNNTSGHKGVSWDKAKQKWEAYIMLNGKQRRLGRYLNINDAAAAYAKASAELHGEFGRIE